MVSISQDILYYTGVRDKLRKPVLVVRGGQDHIIPDPYEFLGYLYYRVDLSPEKFGGADILDSIATTILPKAGYSNADLVLHPDYMPENDPELIASVERYRNEK